VSAVDHSSRVVIDPFDSFNDFDNNYNSESSSDVIEPDYFRHDEVEGPNPPYGYTGSLIDLLTEVVNMGAMVKAMEHKEAMGAEKLKRGPSRRDVAHKTEIPTTKCSQQYKGSILPKFSGNGPIFQMSTAS